MGGGYHRPLACYRGRQPAVVELESAIGGVREDECHRGGDRLRHLVGRFEIPATVSSAGPVEMNH